MSISFPGAAVAVIISALVVFTAGFTYKYPAFTLLDLHAVKGGVFLLATVAVFGFQFGNFILG